jgi:S1-C subfamily serine protease
VTILLGLLGLIGTVTALTLLSTAASNWVAARLGHRPFRLFDVERPSLSLLGGLAIRGAAVVAPLLGIMGFALVGNVLNGELIPTTTIEVIDGPAKQAGLANGDRVVEIDGRTIGSWDELLATVREKSEPRQVVVERAGARVSFDVTPNEKGRIGVTSRYDKGPVVWSKALLHSLEMPFNCSPP